MRWYQALKYPQVHSLVWGILAIATEIRIMIIFGATW